MNTTLQLNTRTEFRHPSFVASSRRKAPVPRRASLVRYGTERCNAHVNEALYLSLYVVTMFVTCGALVLGS